ncbi:endolytic transglycosylase MltG [Vibrio europaeus]|uniref:Endolytic murein transglycosylase n=1 Tax=Vibrio europaeus TaxID=300876 RepID=A0AAE7AWL7_9VIBR|nr:endolytic transglycosylase MltG [Vibrio europaeus]MDC5809835.1 endolytic transglycosylase MltG [Vibrio europaeus]MDC5821254.1 endolytic transglycosylase MltG [Vibrio europaeus]MDC5848851.1 endolytic transglycosylase MltG [Vibrio europaeus]MDC5868265.1 endolytic transglycosylase MltG [Vibrio europaeus]NOH25451.1 endolytic transglycosylase MltG [Vibrio europaeus]
MIKKITLFLLLVAALAAGGYVYVVKQVEQYVNQPLQIEQSQIFTIASGTSFNRVLEQLTESKMITGSDVVKLVRRFHPELTQLRAGTYLLDSGSTLKSTLEQFKQGKEHQFSITFVEGSTFKEWQQIIINAPYLEHELDGLSEAQIAEKLGVPHDKLEGLLLAETYHYTFGASDLDILKRAADKLQMVLDEHWATRQEKLPLKSSYEALILASIIEKETAVESERERVAAVFVNRLNKRMRLQTDPTVIYGMGDKYDGNIRKKDLRTPTPYNTYTIFGLPPTPIAMPGEASIQAALNPEDSNYLYFVASGNGGHVFSKTLAEHNRAVRAYLKQLRSKK